MNEQDLKHAIEATLLAAGRPVTTQQLLDLFEERERPTPEQLQAAMVLLVADYETRGIELIEVASGWRIQVRPRYAEIVSRLWQERPSRYSRALLETLALVAYRQPITRSEIEEIRGVSISSTIMRTMQERNWIRTVGHREVPGRPELLGTTRDFLDYFGLKSLDQLPTLADLQDVENIGVQLELPGGQGAQSAVAEGEAAGEGEGEPVAEGEAAAEDESIAEGEAAVEGEPVAEGEAVAGSEVAAESEAIVEEEVAADGETIAEDEAVEVADDTTEVDAGIDVESEGELSADGDEGDEVTEDESEGDEVDRSTLVASAESDPDAEDRAVREPVSE
ncbi:SMC-Scp complex subunit ScpB [Povalibacter sp.]|uniref:SMC-Scp complex subunit ScpB n=1 Tax=Povalibacter sp. TaxID=1962978 RepID=UPI002F3FA6B4